jgi:hypothetical protein
MSEQIEDLMGQPSYKDIRDLAADGKLPANFNRWELADSSGWTIAHEGALHGCLPYDFDQWDMVNIYGWTVAHSAAGKGGLPEGFDKYWMTDKSGTTVAHYAAAFGHLPADFNLWGMTNSQEVTVLRTVLQIVGNAGTNRDGISYLREIRKRWDKEKPLCRTNADWEVFKQELPEVYYKYAIDETMVVCDEVSNGVMI